MGLLMRHSQLESSSGTLAADLGRYRSGAQWKGVYYRGEKIGFTVDQTVATADGFELQQDGRLQMAALRGDPGSAHSDVRSGRQALRPQILLLLPGSRNGPGLRGRRRPRARATAHDPKPLGNAQADAAPVRASEPLAEPVPASRRRGARCREAPHPIGIRSGDAAQCAHGGGRRGPRGRASRGAARPGLSREDDLRRHLLDLLDHRRGRGGARGEPNRPAHGPGDPGPRHGPRRPRRDPDGHVEDGRHRPVRPSHPRPRQRQAPAAPRRGREPPRQRHRWRRPAPGGRRRRDRRLRRATADPGRSGGLPIPLPGAVHRVATPPRSAPRRRRRRPAPRSLDSGRNAWFGTSTPSSRSVPP